MSNKKSNKPNSSSSPKPKTNPSRVNFRDSAPVPTFELAPPKPPNKKK